MSRALALADGETARTACARVALRRGVDEQTGELLSQAGLAERAGWCADLVTAMATEVTAAHWNSVDVTVLASGQDATARQLPRAAWMALRRLAWISAVREGVKVNDRIVRMAQEQAGSSLRSAQWRAELTVGVLATWPVDPDKRTRDEWDAVRKAAPAGEHLPSSVIRSRTRQIAAFARKHGRMPADVFELEAAPPAARMLLLAACDRQQATIGRYENDPRRALLRLQLPVRPDPGSYRDWTWVACPISLPPTVPPGAVLHLPALRFQNGTVRADLACTHAVPKVARSGHTVALGVDWGLNTLLSAGAARLHDDGRITALGAGAMFRAAGVLAKQHRLRRLGERLQARADQYQRIIDGRTRHGLPAAAPGRAAGRVVLEHVSFRYQPGTPLIEDFSLVAEPGQTVAIVGPTGAGKTTIANLLMRFRHGAPGQLAVRRNDSRQHRLRQAGRDDRRDHGRRPGGPASSSRTGCPPSRTPTSSW